jgi:glutamate-ammonia-ligase adenylyltransferase
VADEAALMRELRLFRRRMMVRIAWAQALSLVSAAAARWRRR